MYLSNKYTIWYYSIIEYAKNQSTTGYKEKHHIIPRSLGGSNSKNNLVNLTARQHFICHILLTKMVQGPAKHKMIRAAMGMKRSRKYQDRYINSRLYESVRKEYSQQRSKEQSGKGNVNFNKPLSQITKQRLSESRKSKGYRWFNNGERNVFKSIAPNGFIEGRIIHWKFANKKGTEVPF